MKNLAAGSGWEMEEQLLQTGVHLSNLCQYRYMHVAKHYTYAQCEAPVNCILPINCWPIYITADLSQTVVINTVFTLNLLHEFSSYSRQSGWSVYISPCPWSKFHVIRYRRPLLVFLRSRIRTSVQMAAAWVPTLLSSTHIIFLTNNIFVCCLKT